jgi:formylglycine-generating enzyme required for sulfatase activity
VNKHIASANVVLVLLLFLSACGTPPDTYTPTPTDTPISEPIVTFTTEPIVTLTTEPTEVPPLTEEDKAYLRLAETGVSANDEWVVYTETINGIEMALVPVGCFLMGSMEENTDELPIHRVCFDKPYWIDVTEVTNGAYGSSGNWAGDDQPRDSISWTDADTHCKSRGARLPTEAEWEYAARGPSDLIYPWGDDFVADNVVYEPNSRHQTAKVGSRPGGISWVGAFDLSGNVSEWVNDRYDTDYYETLVEGVVNPQGAENGTDASLLRGGYWNIGNPTYLRAAYRGKFNPSDLLARALGFRCAHSYN